MPNNKSPCKSNSRNPAAPEQTKVDRAATNGFDQGDLKILDLSKEAMELANLLGLDHPHLKSLRAAASPFKWSQKRNLSEAGRLQIKAISANRQISPGDREDQRNSLIRDERTKAKNAHARRRHEARQWIGFTHTIRLTDSKVQLLNANKVCDACRLDESTLSELVLASLFPSPLHMNPPLWAAPVVERWIIAAARATSEQERH